MGFGIWDLISMLPTYFIIFVIGLCIGSFIDCLVWRLNRKKTILGRSICPQCKKKIAWYDNIPLISFIILRGRCRHCKKKISFQYPLVELATGILFVIVWLRLNNTSDFVLQTSYLLLLRDLIFISILIVIFIYDLRWYLILDIITVPAMALALVLNFFLGFNCLNLLIAAAIGGGFFLLQYVVSRGKWIGGGDIRLGVLMGLMLGYPQIIVALMLAYILGSIVGIMLLAAKKKQWSSQIPFGAFLSAATVVVLLWGEKILDWYLGIIF